MDLTTLARKQADNNKERIQALLSGDSAAAYQSLMNMYTNAIRASSKGFTLDELLTEMDRLEAKDHAASDEETSSAS